MQEKTDSDQWMPSKSTPHGTNLEKTTPQVPMEVPNKQAGENVEKTVDKTLSRPQQRRRKKKVVLAQAEKLAKTNASKINPKPGNLTTMNLQISPLSHEDTDPAQSDSICPNHKSSPPPSTTGSKNSSPGSPTKPGSHQDSSVGTSTPSPTSSPPSSKASGKTFSMPQPSSIGTELSTTGEEDIHPICQEKHDLSEDGDSTWEEDPLENENLLYLKELQLSKPAYLAGADSQNLRDNKEILAFIMVTNRNLRNTFSHPDLAQPTTSRWTKRHLPLVHQLLNITARDTLVATAHDERHLLLLGTDKNPPIRLPYWWVETTNMSYQRVLAQPQGMDKVKNLVLLYWKLLRDHKNHMARSNYPLLNNSGRPKTSLTADRPSQCLEQHLHYNPILEPKPGSFPEATPQELDQSEENFPSLPTQHHGRQQEDQSKIHPPPTSCPSKKQGTKMLSSHGDTANSTEVGETSTPQQATPSTTEGTPCPSPPHSTQEDTPPQSVPSYPERILPEAFPQKDQSEAPSVSLDTEAEKAESTQLCQARNKAPCQSICSQGTSSGRQSRAQSPKGITANCQLTQVIMVDH
jgi:hypothetical protein